MKVRRSQRNMCGIRGTFLKVATRTNTQHLQNFPILFKFKIRDVVYIFL